MPWTFDAAHYPFLYLHCGYALPSFLCFAGILTAAYMLMRDRYGTDSGLVAAAGLLGLPMLVYQGVNTKNDLVLAFGTTVWFYALYHYVRAPRRLHLSMAAIALAIVIGSKTTGLFLGPLAVALTPPSVFATIWRRRDLLWFIAAIAIAFLLWSSWEIYLNNKLQFGFWLGDPSDYRFLQNQDRWRGFIANFVRYFLGFCDPFILPHSARVVFGHWKSALCDGLLTHFGLIDAGTVKSDWRSFGHPDFDRISAGVYTENTSTFGLLGTLALFVAIFVVIRWDRSKLAFQFVLFSLASFIGITALLGWQPSGYRFFVVPFTFAFFGLVAWVYDSDVAWRIWVLRSVALLSLWWVPVVSMSKPLHRFPIAIMRPNDLLPESETLLRARLDKLAADGQLPLLLYCGKHAKSFYVFDRLRENVIPVVHLDQVTFNELKSRYGKSSYPVLVMNSEMPQVEGLEQPEHMVSQNEERKRWSDTLFIWTGSH